MKRITSKIYYEKIKDNFKVISKEKNNYISSIDSIIINKINKDVNKFLDIGTGDGSRAIKISKHIGAKKIYLLENCPEMINPIYYNKDINIIEDDILNFKTEEKFDVITCLWNVLGHIQGKSDRYLAINKMYNYLAKDGLLFIDVNNRYNLKNYGLINFLKNIKKDISNSKEAGFYNLKIENSSTSVYIHLPFEINKIAKEVGFKTIEQKFINYDNGMIEKNFLGGQSFYSLKK